MSTTSSSAASTSDLFLNDWKDKASMPHMLQSIGVKPQDHYAILAVPLPVDGRPPISKQDLKQAYHRALLLHHPDKNKALHTPHVQNVPSVDQISLAYHILGDDKLRADYDRRRALEIAARRKENEQSDHFSGIEMIDLDDMIYDEKLNMFYRGCRCGKERGFSASESQLEANEDSGEIVIGCQGCSLWLKVLFDVAQEDG